MFDNLRFAVQRSRGRTTICAHVDAIRDGVVPTSDVCEPCVAADDTWVHLRSCMTCGAVGCCNSSKNKHASRHASEIDHPIARSIEPGEDWMWCFVDDVIVAG
jgi:uncharacterized UBP type Zn finger protein